MLGAEPADQLLTFTVLDITAREVARVLLRAEFSD